MVGFEHDIEAKSFSGDGLVTKHFEEAPTWLRQISPFDEAVWEYSVPFLVFFRGSPKLKLNFRDETHLHHRDSLFIIFKTFLSQGEDPELGPEAEVGGDLSQTLL
jgi:hypothetical protein